LENTPVKIYNVPVSAGTVKEPSYMLDSLMEISEYGKSPPKITDHHYILIQFILSAFRYFRIITNLSDCPIY